MAGAGKRFGADKLLPAQVDFWLVPELDPSAVQCLIEIDPAGGRRRVTELEFMDDLENGLRLDRLLERRQHLQAVLFANMLDVRQHGRTATAEELNGAAIIAGGEFAEALDRLGKIQRDV